MVPVSATHRTSRLEPTAACRASCSGRRSGVIFEARTQRLTAVVATAVEVAAELAAVITGVLH
jgi:hypothetical protein